MSKKKSGGLLVGIILIIIGSIFLVKNEGNNVKNIKIVDEIKKNAIAVTSDTIDQANDGKLVATSGTIVVEDESVIDYAFNIAYKTPILKRNVEVYEWEEEKNTDDDNNTTYTYNKVWSSEINDSSKFNDGTYSNPTFKSLDDEIYIANNVRVGLFYLSVSQKQSLSASKTLNLSNQTIEMYGYKIVDNYITNSEDFSNPQIGDIRIYYTYNDYSNASVLAKQISNTFDNYVSNSGKVINRVFEGNLTLNEMISRIQDENNIMKWIARVVGAFIIITGYLSLLSGLKKLSEVIPFIGKIVSKVLSLIGTLIGIIQSLIIIVISWFAYRPILSIVLLIIIAVLIVIIVILVNKSKEKQVTVNENIN